MPKVIQPKNPLARGGVYLWQIGSKPEKCWKMPYNPAIQEDISRHFISRHLFSFIVAQNKKKQSTVHSCLKANMLTPIFFEKKTPINVINKNVIIGRFKGVSANKNLLSFVIFIAQKRRQKANAPSEILMEMGEDTANRIKKNKISLSKNTPPDEPLPRNI